MHDIKKRVQKNEKGIIMTIYVTMTDRFLSGWGLANGRISKFVVICDSFEQAETVKKNAMLREDMKNVNICVNKPRYNLNKYHVSYKNYNELGACWKK